MSASREPPDPGRSRPDLTGTWILDLDRSSLEVPAPDSSAFLIDHAEPKIIAERTHVLGEESNTVRTEFTTDGALRTVQVGDMEIPTRLYWVGETLVLEQEWSVGDVRVRNRVRYTLADGGRTLVADEHLAAGSDGHHNIWTYGKQ